MFEYQRCVELLRKKAEVLKTAGFTVEIAERTDKSFGARIGSASPDSFCTWMKADSDSTLSELRVWGTGKTAMAVYDLSQDRYLIDNSAIVLTSGFECELDRYYFCLLKL